MLPLCLATSLGCAIFSGCAGKNADASVVSESHADRIVVVKSTHALTLYTGGRALREYRVALGTASGPKDHRGDHKTPEGSYVIDSRNAKSRFHLALHVSYPSEADRRRALAEGQDPGDAIMIHGVPEGFAWIGEHQHDVDWTDGCIAVTNPQIEEIWRLVPLGTPIEIKP